MINMVNSAKTPTGKSSKGSIGIQVRDGRLQLNLPRDWYGGKQKRFMLGLADTEVNRKVAEKKARQIELDYASGNFDPTLEKYKPQSHLSIASATEAKKAQIPLKELWSRYCLYKENQIERTTMLTSYANTTKHINELPTQNILEAVAIRDSLLTKLKPTHCRDTLLRINAACEWALGDGLLEKNPFIGMADAIKVPRKNDDSIDPFSKEEMNAIIEAFDEHPLHRHYAPYVRFLFWTGCRTGEAIGLRWEHISSDCKEIRFSESISTGFKIRKGTKNGQARKFPCSERITNLLLSIRPETVEPDELVFKSKTGKMVDEKNFCRIWHGYTTSSGNWSDGIISKLMADGLVKRYRPQYNTRHTFVTLTLEAGITVQQVARWVGNTPQMILKHYAGTHSHIRVPEF